MTNYNCKLCGTTVWDTSKHDELHQLLDNLISALAEATGDTPVAVDKLIVDALTNYPGMTQKEIVTATNLKADVVRRELAVLDKVGLLTWTTVGNSKAYSLKDGEQE